MRACLLFAVPVFALAASHARAEDEHPVVKLIKSKVKDVKKPFALMVSFKVKAGQEKEFLAAFEPALAATRKEPGCVAYYLNRDTDDPNTYVMYEQFKGIPAIEEHLKAKHTQTLLSTIGPMTDGDPKIKVYVIPE